MNEDNMEQFPIFNILMSTVAIHNIDVKLWGKTWVSPGEPPMFVNATWRYKTNTIWTYWRWLWLNKILSFKDVTCRV